MFCCSKNRVGIYASLVGLCYLGLLTLEIKTANSFFINLYTVILTSTLTVHGNDIINFRIKLLDKDRAEYFNSLVRCENIAPHKYKRLSSKQ
jgi:hypothetical protein